MSSSSSSGISGYYGSGASASAGNGNGNGPKNNI